MICRVALAIALTLVASPTLAGPAEDRAGLAELQREDARLQSLGWRLATGNARFCPDAAPAIGLLLQDMANYGKPAGMRAAAGIAGDIAVQAVAARSPAAEAGLAPNTEILVIDGCDPADAREIARGFHRELEHLVTRHLASAPAPAAQRLASIDAGVVESAADATATDIGREAARAVFGAMTR